MQNSKRLPTYFIPHGGGPCFFLKPEDFPPGMPKNIWNSLESYLRGIDGLVGRRPKAVLVISAHWMTPRITLGSAEKHHLLYDYYGFPDYTYQLNYPARGAPEVARRAAELLMSSGIEADFDSERGIDHGVFVPFMLIYPDADVPIVPMSLSQDLDAAKHLEIGRALAPLRDEDVLIIGSGMSFHNMRAIMTGTHNAEAATFDAWLLTAAEAAPDQRTSLLAQWEREPSGRIAHPQEEHLIPLMVAAGAAATDRGRQSFGGTLGGKALSGFTFG
jgi:aromatic ring-opening dioxygenase catalytic subunit (LigB family)